MPPELGAEHRLLADLGAVEHEGIEDLAGGTVVITICVAAQAMLAGRVAVQRIAGLDRPGLPRRDQVAGIVRLPWKRVGIGADIVIGMVVPARGTDPKTHLALIDHVQLGQQVDPLGHRTADTEILVTVVVVGGAGNLRILAFHPLTVTGLQGVIETHGPILTITEFKGLGSRHGREQCGAGQQAQMQRTGSCRGVHCVVSVFCCFCFLALTTGSHPVLVPLRVFFRRFDSGVCD
ncbi:hypothetical protein D3C76_839520 [compost metagenome]